MKRKKRIAVLAPDLSEHGGVQSIVEMVVQLIEASGMYECRIISLATSALDPVSVRLHSPATWFRGVQVETREWRGRQIVHVGCWWSELEFMRYSQRRALSMLLTDCDLVQVVGGFPAWGASVVRHPLPVANWAATRCLWERSTLLQGPINVKALWRRVMTYLVDKIDARAVAAADKFMVMNPLMRQYAIQGIEKSVCDVVDAAPGVDTEYFVPPTAAQRNGLKDDYILCVGRLGDSRKNPELLLESFILIREAVSKDIRLVLAGATAPGAHFWDRADRAGIREWISFHATPSQQQLRSLYQGAVCLALSSNEEGFGMVLVESMACATPVVATSCGGPEGIVTDGSEGFLVPIGDAGALAARLELLIHDRDLRNAMGKRARQTVLQRFSDVQSGKNFLKVWGDLLGTTDGK